MLASEISLATLPKSFLEEYITSANMTKVAIFKIIFSFLFFTDLCYLGLFQADKDKLHQLLYFL